jgi:ATP-dependent DNA helicase DinG
MSSNRALFLSVQLGDDAHLLLNLRDPSSIIEVSDLNHIDEIDSGSVIIIDGDSAEVIKNNRDQLFVQRGFIWSLISPLDAGSEIHLSVSDRLGAEQTLRREGWLFWNGLKFWAARTTELRERCRSNLASFSALCAEVLELLNEIVIDGVSNPFSRWEDNLPEVVHSGPVSVPRDPVKLSKWLVAADGLGTLYGDNFIPREAQGIMGRDVAGALQSRTPMLIEAGTGVGKSLAYLTPLLTMAGSGVRVIVSTNTIALQNQLMNTDLPLLHHAFQKLKYRRLMGRSNYLCNSSLKRFFERSVESLADAWSLVSLLLWLEISRFGMKEEISTHPGLSRDIYLLFGSADSCSSALCFGSKPCFVQQARKAAREADVVVVNHSLLVNDLIAGNTLIGEYDHLVIDEAHRLPAVALDACSVVCSSNRSAIIKELLGDKANSKSVSEVILSTSRALLELGKKGQAASKLVHDYGKSISKTLNSYHQWLQDISELQEAAKVEYSAKARVYNPADYLKSISKSTANTLVEFSKSASVFALVAGAVNEFPDLSSGLEDSFSSLVKSSEMLAELEKDMMFLTSSADNDWVYWIEPGRDNRLPAYGATQLESGEVLAPFWKEFDLAPIATSATLSAAGNYQFMARELGISKLPGGFLESDIVSCFDYEKNALFCTTPTFPEPNHSDYMNTMIFMIKHLVTSIPRKTMILFTSYRTLTSIADALENDNPEYNFHSATDKNWIQNKPVILSQGRGVVASELISRFRRESRAVLLGTNTFWEGVDLPGDELELLIIPKLPFLVPNDPWVQARCERIKAEGENPFSSFLVVDAMLRLRQGTGRLIRTVNDRGVVVLLDSRLHTKNYGLNFMKTFPVAARQCANSTEVLQVSEKFFSETS